MALRHWSWIIHQNTINIETSQIVYNGEIQGVIYSIEYANKVAKQHNVFRIFSDNQAGLYRLNRPSDNSGQDCQIRAIDLTKSIIAKGASVELHWSPGHFNIAGNELADKLAKLATLKESNSNDTSFAVLGLKINNLKRTEWNQHFNSAKPTTYSKRYNWRIRSKLLVPVDTKRELASAFYQLKFGHGYIKTYLYKLNHTENDKCSCGKVETVEHLLLSCKATKEARKELKKDMNGTTLNLRVLLNTEYGALKTLKFLKATGIVTRKWHLERVEREGMK